MFERSHVPPGLNARTFELPNVRTRSGKRDGAATVGDPGGDPERATGDRGRDPLPAAGAGPGARGRLLAVPPLSAPAAAGPRGTRLDARMARLARSGLAR